MNRCINKYENSNPDLVAKIYEKNIFSIVHDNLNFDIESIDKQDESKNINEYLFSIKSKYYNYVESIVDFIYKEIEDVINEEKIKH